MQKLINDPGHLVQESLEGFAAAHAELLEVSFDPDIVTRRDAPVVGEVALLSGGGSGHEPLHAGFVGPGMLHGACPGPIFTSPTPDQILAATRRIESGAGVVYLVKNYSGDVMNFELAAELAREAGIDVELVLIDDDIAVPRAEGTQGRRGVAGTLLVEKLAGASAARGAPLKQVADVARTAVTDMRSMGVALSSCTIPIASAPAFALGAEEMEIGIGIHGERGRARLPREPADALVGRLVDPLLGELDLQAGTQALVLVNSLGATTLAELYVVYRRVHQLLAASEITISRRLIGHYVTSLDMQGCSVTILKMTPERMDLWDYPVHTASLRWGR